MDTLQQIKKPVEQELNEFEKHFRNSISSNVPLLDIITNYIIRHKGKQIRPLFVFLSAKLMGDINKSTYNAASLIELLHTASLIHDDVVDESYERRNHFSINAIWKTKVAVLVGDYFLAQGLLLSVEHKEFEMLKSVSTAVKEMSEGELLQIQSSNKMLIDIDNYFNIIEKKTAALIAACTLCGAQSSSGNSKHHEQMHLFGLYAGIAFQIKDDLFDYQKKGIIGKPTGNDIKEKKFTLPLILALKNASPAERRQIIRLVDKNDNSSTKIEKVIEFAIRNNGISHAEEYLLEYKNKALKILDDFPDSEAKTSLLMLVDYVISRSK